MSTTITTQSKEASIKGVEAPGSKAKHDCIQVIADLFGPKQRCEASGRAGTEARAPVSLAAPSLCGPFPLTPCSPPFLSLSYISRFLSTYFSFV